ncbi:MAG: hypothetical protein JSW11_04755 [Candidatus Heimdallarchaeota archaeon]|nr:MAG: hypothetical protein JSW11_04755 [Candidatus Heimdallarchaeota archaeon]
MDSLQWFEITKEALTLAESDLDVSQLDSIVLIQLDPEIQTFSTTEPQIDIKTSTLLGQTWHYIVDLLTDELLIESWNSLSIKSRNKAISIHSLGHNVVLVVISDAAIDTIDIIKVILKYIFQIGYQDKYETVGLVSTDGFPVWVTSIEEIDDFLFAISITSLLSLVERIDMEVSAGGVGACILQGTENLLLNVAFNPSQDLVLAVTQKGSNIEDVALDLELSSLYQKTADPVLFSAIVPEITDEDRERMLEEIRQAFEGETTEEEIQTLNVFDTEMLSSLENEIKTVAKKYGAKEISIGYLRKRMKLPAEVLSMALQYLIGEGTIEGRIGTERKTGSEILVVDIVSERSEQDQKTLDLVKDQISEIFNPINTHLSQLPEAHLPETAVQEELITETLGEFQIMLTLSDTDPLFLLTNDLRIAGTQIEGSVKSLVLTKKQLSETEPDDVLRAELERRVTNLDEKISEQKLTIIGKAKRFYEDLLNSYRLIFRLLPPPNKFRRSRGKKIANIIFTCPGHNCEKYVRIRDNISTWVKLYVFANLLGIQKDDFSVKFPPNIVKLRSSIEDRLNRLSSLISDSEMTINLELADYLFIENLDDLLITNTQRDKAINILKRVKIEQNLEEKDFYSLFTQCNSCNKWYCTEHMSTTNKCQNC